MAKIKVEKVFINKENAGKRKGAVLFTVDDTVTIRGTIVDGKNGLFVALPQTQYEKDGEKKYIDEVTFVNKEVSAEVQKIVLNAFKTQQVGGSTSTPTATPKSAPKSNTTGAGDIPQW